MRESRGLEMMRCPLPRKRRGHWTVLMMKRTMRRTRPNIEKRWEISLMMTLMNLMMIKEAGRGRRKRSAVKDQDHLVLGLDQDQDPGRVLDHEGDLMMKILMKMIWI